MTRKQDILDTAADKAKAAAEFGSTTWDERIAPLLQSASEKVAPVADEAWQAAKEATRRAAGLAAGTVERIQPGVNATLSKVAPAVDRAQKAVQDDLLPKLLELLRSAAATPAGSEARDILSRLDERADASMGALKTELAKSKKTSTTKKIITIAAIGAVLGALAIAIRTFLGSREDWAAYEPDEPYVYPDDDYEIDEVMIEDETPAEPTAPADALEASPDPAAAPAEADAAPADAAETAPAEEPAPAPDSAPYGEGSYAGANPPEGFVIKGNERSMKYHLPDAAGYARTTADVWFSSEEAAQTAGFARSQR